MENFFIEILLMKLYFMLIVFWAIVLFLLGTVEGFTINQKDTAGSAVNYPVRFTYIDSISSWTIDGINAGFGIPGYSP